MKPLLQIFDHQIPISIWSYFYCFVFPRSFAFTHIILSLESRSHPGTVGMEELMTTSKVSKPQAHTSVPHGNPHSESAHPCWTGLVLLVNWHFSTKCEFNDCAFTEGNVDFICGHQILAPDPIPNRPLIKIYWIKDCISWFSPYQLENKLKKNKNRTQNQKPNHIPLIHILSIHMDGGLIKFFRVIRKKCA